MYHLNVSKSCSLAFGYCQRVVIKKKGPKSPKEFHLSLFFSLAKNHNNFAFRNGELWFIEEEEEEEEEERGTL